MKLDLTALEKAFTQLEKSIAYLQSDNSKSDRGLYEQFRAATVQAFEYTFELIIKMIQRQLQQIITSPDSVKTMNYKDVLRLALDAKLIRSFDSFVEYREKRNITSHTYEEEEAEKIIENIDCFLEDAKYTLNELKNRNR